MQKFRNDLYQVGCLCRLIKPLNVWIADENITYHGVLEIGEQIVVLNVKKGDQATRCIILTSKGILRTQSWYSFRSFDDFVEIIK